MAHGKESGCLISHPSIDTGEPGTKSRVTDGQWCVEGAGGRRGCGDTKLTLFP